MIVWGNGLPGVPAATAGGGIVPALPGLVHHYRTPTLSGWPDRVGGVDGVHTGSPSLASGGPRFATTGAAYNGSSQWTSLVSAAAMTPLVTSRQGYVGGWIYVAAGTGQLHTLLGQTGTGGEAGWSLCVDDRAAATRRVLFLASNGSGGGGLSSTQSADSAVPADTLVHVAACLDGAGGVELFVAGGSVATGTVPASAATACVRDAACGVLPQSSLTLYGAHSAWDIAVSSEDLTAYVPAIAAEGAP
jgi:hypothetical protein